MEAIQPTASGFRRKIDHGTDSAAEDPPVTRDNTSSVADVHRSEISSLVADVHQSRGINGREADVLPLTVNPPATNGVEESSLVADVHQSRGINGREADVLPLTVNPPATNGVEESGKYCAYVHKLLDSSVAFSISCSSGTKQ